MILHQPMSYENVVAFSCLSCFPFLSCPLFSGEVGYELTTA